MLNESVNCRALFQSFLAQLWLTDTVHGRKKKYFPVLNENQLDWKLVVPKPCWCTSTASEKAFALCCTLKEWMFRFVLCLNWLPLILILWHYYLLEHRATMYKTSKCFKVDFILGIIGFCKIDWIIRINGQTNWNVAFFCLVSDCREILNRL